MPFVCKISYASVIAKELMLKKDYQVKNLIFFKYVSIIFSLEKQTIQFLSSSYLYFQQNEPQNRHFLLTDGKLCLNLCHHKQSQ